jgi:CheY-like chemotaxis protein
MAKTILLADDSITIQKIVNLTFSGEGIDVVTVSNGDAALKKIREIHPDLVLADIFMPGENGYELCEHLKNDPEFCRTPVILLVGAYEPFDQNEAARVKADGHLTKPFEIRVLISAVNSLIDAAQQAAAASTSPGESVPETGPEPEVAVELPVEAPSAELSVAPEEENFTAASMPVETSTEPEKAPAEMGDIAATPSEMVKDLSEKIPSVLEESPLEKEAQIEIFALPATLEEPLSSGQESEPELPALEALSREQPSAEKIETLPPVKTIESAIPQPIGGSMAQPHVSTLPDNNALDEADVLDISVLEIPPSFTGEEIKDQIVEAGANVIDIWEPPPGAVLASDQEIIVKEEKAERIPAAVQKETKLVPLEAMTGAAIPLVMENLAPVESMSSPSEEPPAEEKLLAMEQPIVSPTPPPIAPSISAALPLDEEALAERIAQKVIQKLSKEAIERIAWEVIPDLAELMIKEQVKVHLKQISQN